MEPRKEKEIEHYDKEASEILNTGEGTKEVGNKENFNPFLLSSYSFLRLLVIEKARNKKILDYGCGTGIHLNWLAELSKELIGIDLSEKSLNLANKRIKKENLENKTNVLLMDCEKTSFLNNFFDIIFNSGTFSSLDLDKVLPELARILKPDGFLIGIETLGHNPFTNFKRFLNRIFGKRTIWASKNIFRVEDLKKVRKYFNKIDVYYFHLISWICFPFLKLFGGEFILKLFEKIDNFFLFIFPFLKKYCFKIVFVFSDPKK